MGLSGIKAQARQALHSAMAEPASYTAPGGTTYPTAEQVNDGLALTVRWHNKMRISGERDSTDAAILEGVNRLIFNNDELAALGITLERRGLVAIPGYSKSFRLEYHEDSDGPLNDYWTVVEL